MDVLFENRYYSNRKMMAEFGRKYAVGPKVPLMIICGLLYVFVAVPVFLVPDLLGSDSRILLALVGIAMVAAGFTPQLYARSAIRNVKKQNDGIQPEVIITFGETIELHEGMVHITVEYRKIQRVIRLKHSYMLMIGKRNGVMLEPNSFTKGTFHEFKQFLREKRPDLNIPE